MSDGRSDEARRIYLLENAIGIRERKARYLGVALLLFVGGFALYCTAIAQLLMAARPA